MSTPCIISVAITGSLPRKKDNPAGPITVAEQVESTQAAFEAGATLVHLHVRNDDETPTSSADRFALVLDGIRKHCPGMITQVGITPNTMTAARMPAMALIAHRKLPAPDISNFISSNSPEGLSEMPPLSKVITLTTRPSGFLDFDEPA